MNIVRSITFSKKVSLGLYGLSFLILGYSLSVANLWQANMWIFTFVIGALAAYPVINYSWRDVKENWGDGGSMGEMSYRDLFEGDLNKEERNELVKKHWRNVLWIVPYAFTVYLYLSFMLASLITDYALLPFFAGSVLSIGFTSYEYQKTFDI